MIPADLLDLPACDSVYVSPHDDDVTLSCPGRLLSERSRGLSILLVSVFGSVAGERQVSAGLAAPAETALARLGVLSLSLGIPEAGRRSSYYSSFISLAYARHPEDQTWLEQAAEKLTEIAHRTKAGQVYVPLGVGGHIDHRLCHEASLRAFRGGDGRNVFLYEERPEALLPGAVRLRLSQIGARLPPAASAVAAEGGFARFLLGFHVAPSLRADLKGWPERLRSFGPAARQWRQVRNWHPQKSFGPRLQPVVYPLGGEELAVSRELASALIPPVHASRQSARRLQALAAAYGKRLGAAEQAERYWLLLPPREMDGEVPPPHPGEPESPRS